MNKHTWMGFWAGAVSQHIPGGQALSRDGVQLGVPCTRTHEWVVFHRMAGGDLCKSLHLRLMRFTQLQNGNIYSTSLKAAGMR